MGGLSQYFHVPPPPQGPRPPAPCPPISSLPPYGADVFPQAGFDTGHGAGSLPTHLLQIESALSPHRLLRF